MGEIKPGQVYAIGLHMSADEIARIRSQLPVNTELAMDEPGSLGFKDHYGIIWQISVPGTEFQTTGVNACRWLEL